MLPINKFGGFSSNTIQKESEAKVEQNQSFTRASIFQGIAMTKDGFDVAATKASIFESYGSEIIGKVRITPRSNINEISQFTGVPVDQLQSIFAKNGLTPGKLPYPPDEKVIAFLKDPAFASLNEADLLWKVYNNFEGINQQPSTAPQIDSNLNMISPLLEAIIPNGVQGVRDAAVAQAKFQEISDLTGKSLAEVEQLFQKYHMKPSSLPQPPDYNVLAFLKDPTFSAVSPSLLLYATYGW